MTNDPFKKEVLRLLKHSRTWNDVSIDLNFDRIRYSRLFVFQSGIVIKEYYIVPWYAGGKYFWREATRSNIYYGNEKLDYNSAGLIKAGWHNIRKTAQKKFSMLFPNFERNFLLLI